MFTLVKTLVFCGAVLCAGVAYGQTTSVNPATVESLIEVTSISLDGFSSIDDYPLDIATLHAQVAREREQFGPQMSVDELHQVADALTLYVREQGLVFHTVYLPPQKVEDGHVRLALQEGVLQGVHVISNSSKVDSERLIGVFEPLLGEMIYGPDVERKVQALKAQSGVQVFAFYSRGSEPGQARLNLKAAPAKKYFASLTLDNFGSATSGEYRAIGQLSITQFTNRFDTLSIAVLAAVDDVANTYGSVYYSLPSPGLNYTWDISASNNQFELGDRFANLGLEGDAVIYKTGVSWNRLYERNGRESWRLGYYAKYNKLDDDTSRVEQEHSKAVSLGLRKSVQWPQAAAGSQWLAAVAHGDMARQAGESEAFTKADASVQLVKGFATGNRLANVFSLSLSGQYTDINLPSVESFSLTGAYGVRGFEPGLFSADVAGLASLEWSFPRLMRNESGHWYLEPFAFVDGSQGKKLEFYATPESEGSFAGAGGGIRFGFGKYITGQLYGASPIDGSINEQTVYGDTLWRFELKLQ